MRILLEEEAAGQGPPVQRPYAARGAPSPRPRAHRSRRPHPDNHQPRVPRGGLGKHTQSRPARPARTPVHTPDPCPPAPRCP
jgi:hypothetical protein